MNRNIQRICAFCLTLLLSGVFGLPIFAAGSGGEDEVPVPETEEAELSLPQYEYAVPAVPVTDEPVSSVTTSKTPAVIEPPATQKVPNAPDSEDDDRGFFSGLIDGVKTFVSDLIKGVSGSIAAVQEKVNEVFDGLTNLPGKIWDSFISSVTGWVSVGSGQRGLLDILEDGGRTYVTNTLNKTIDALYEVFYIPGIVVMVICFCYSMFRGCYSLELGDKNSVIKPLIGMIITLFAFTMSKNIMSGMYQVSVWLTEKIITAAHTSGAYTDVDDLLTYSNQISLLGYTVVNGILQLILMVNIAKIALLQATAPLYIGFAPAENTRRIMLNLLKEYGKCCLVPPITAAYAILTFCICDSTFGLFASIVIGISIWNIASKHLDKILN